MTKLSYPGSPPYFPDGHFRPAQTPTTLQRGPAGNLTQWNFHEVQEHSNQNSDEKVMTIRSWRSHMTKLSHPGSPPYFPDGHFRPEQTTNALQKGPDRNLTQWAFHEVQEHSNRNSDEKVMTFRSWRSHMTKLSHPGSPPYFPDGHFRPSQTINAIQRGLDGNLTQWAFHEVQEHPNRNSDEKVMTFRSWRSHMTKLSYPGSPPYFPDGHFRLVQTPTALQRGLSGNLAQWDFHEVQEHPYRNSDEKVMTFRSWRSHKTKLSHPGSQPDFPGRPFPVVSDTHCP